ncbi:MAG: hypothetical protein EBR55_09390 [Chitinophagia bacterium]|nr:hypothetical protein [Chitinophagia bacterium]
MRDMYRKLPPMGGQPREISEVVNNLVEGKSNNTGEFTLATGGATTTTIYNERIGYESVILIEPVTMVAATDYYPYLAVQDGTDQSAASTTTAYAVTFNTTDYALGASLSNSSRLNVNYSGLYNLQFSIQFANTDTQIQDVDIWFRKNGTDIANSNSKFSVPNSHGTQVTIEQLPAQTSPTRPATPSAIATLQYLSSNSYTTNLFTGTYVSAQTKGSATITHPANTVSNRTYRYIIVG